MTAKLIVDTLEGRSAGSNIITVPTGHTLYAPGHIVQVQTAVIGPARISISSTSPTAVTGLSVSITPKNANSRMVVYAAVHGSSTYVNSYAIFKDGIATVSTSGQTNNNEANMQITTYKNSSSNDLLWVEPLMHTELSGSTAARTYQVYVTSGWSGTTYTTHINNRNSNDMAGFSYMWVMEIAI